MVTVLQIGLFSSLPYALLGFFAMMSGLVADCLNLQTWITLTVIRKLFTCSGQFASMSKTLVTTYKTSDTITI